VNKIIRHFYNAYLHMDLRFEIYPIDWFRMSSFYVTYSLEYLISLLVVVTAIPEVKKSPIIYKNEFLNFSFDYLFVLLFYVCASIPYFLNTIVYLHSKRSQMLYYANLHHEHDE
jgi:hypothetical protein